MPIFEYICKECHHQFEALVYGKEKAECPKCHAKKLEPQLSVFAVSAKGSSPSASPTRSLRIVRRSSRPGRLLAGRHELVPTAQLAHPSARCRLRRKCTPFTCYDGYWGRYVFLLFQVL